MRVVFPWPTPFMRWLVKSLSDSVGHDAAASIADDSVSFAMLLLLKLGPRQTAIVVRRESEHSRAQAKVGYTVAGKACDWEGAEIITFEKGGSALKREAQEVRRTNICGQSTEAVLARRWRPAFGLLNVVACTAALMHVEG